METQKDKRGRKPDPDLSPEIAEKVANHYREYCRELGYRLPFTKFLRIHNYDPRLRGRVNVFSVVDAETPKTRNLTIRVPENLLAGLEDVNISVYVRGLIARDRDQGRKA